MFQAILPVARVAAPFVIQGAIKAAQVIGITSVATYGATRTITHVVDPGTFKGETKTETVKNELRFGAEVLWTAAKQATPAALLFGAGVVVTPIAPYVGVPLVAASYVVAALPLFRTFVPKRRKAEWVDITVTEDEVVADFEADKVRPEHHAMWDQAALEDTEVELAELDIARFQRHPGKSGAEFARQLNTTDAVNIGIARSLLGRQLRDNGVADNKVAQALAGFDRHYTTATA